MNLLEILFCKPLVFLIHLPPCKMVIETNKNILADWSYYTSRSAKINTNSFEDPYLLIK